jgi:hypothetical protein
MVGKFRSMRRFRQAFAFRPLAVLMAVWLPLFIGEPNLLSPCPAHGAYAVAHGLRGGAAHHHAHAAMAGTMRGDMAASSSQSAPAQHDEKDCSCIGCCTPGLARAAVADAPIAIVAVATYEPAPEFPPVETQPQPTPDLARHYPTGPPRA